MTFDLRLKESREVKTLLTTRMASPGSLLEEEAVREDAMLSTSSTSSTNSVSVSSASSCIWSNNFITSLPLSLNHLENKEWALISKSRPLLNFSLLRINTFCANALQRVVLPVPGGPCNNIIRFQAMISLSICASAKHKDVLQYPNNCCLIA